MGKKLFEATFEESQSINPNLFSKNIPISYNLGPSREKMISRILDIIPYIFVSVISYALGVGLPETASDGTIKFGLKDIWFGTSEFNYFKFLILGVIILWGLMICINIIPKPNYSIIRMFEVANLFFMILLMDFAMLPMLLGTTLGATGWLGFIIICIYGITFFVSSIQSKAQKIKQEMFGDHMKIKLNYSMKIWSALKKIWVIPFGLILINIFTFRLGMRGSFSLWSFVWIFAGPIYFGILTLFSAGPMKLFVSSFYFAKYAEQYRALWSLTDEQWYGKRKSKNIKKKK
ncbi:MAG: hypothetical protein H9W82_16360 [Lactobacillus sp.]|nr:hypothetical protein [Lactobacillus sp.]